MDWLKSFIEDYLIKIKRFNRQDEVEGLLLSKRFSLKGLQIDILRNARTLEYLTIQDGFERINDQEIRQALVINSLRQNVKPFNRSYHYLMKSWMKI